MSLLCCHLSRFVRAQENQDRQYQRASKVRDERLMPRIAPAPAKLAPLRPNVSKARADQLRYLRSCAREMEKQAASVASGLEGTGQAVTPLLLSASDDTGLAVETKALLVASAPGTVGNDPYVDSNRGGSDTPLDGGLGIGPGNTAISRFRRSTSGGTDPQRQR